MSTPSAAVAQLLPVAEAVVARVDATGAGAALELAGALREDVRLLFELDKRLAGTLVVHLLDLPQRLSLAGLTEPALAVARAFQFVAPDDLAGDIAVILARAGQRELALSRVEANLASAGDAFVAEAKAGDAYRALGEDDAAEVYYRRSLGEAKNRTDRSVAMLRIVSFLLDSGREADADAFVKEQRRLDTLESA